MSTSITWTDDIGAAMLTNSKTFPADRFAAWTPSPMPESSRVVGLGTGAVHEWRFRTDYTASFKLEYIERDDLDLVDRLIQQLLSGGSITVNTGDGSSHSYTCTLAPGTTPTVEMMSDRTLIEYVLTLAVRNSSAAPLLCEYQ